MEFHGHQVIETTWDVWHAIRVAHDDLLGVWSTFTDPDKTAETVYGLKGADYPLMAAKSTWDMKYSPEFEEHTHRDEKHTYYLIIPIKEEEE